MYSFNTRRYTRGFTIVELLIVIVVIGILAAITIVAYTGIQNRAYNATVRSDMAGLVKKMEIWRVDSSSGTYPSIAEIFFADIKVSKNAYSDDPSRNNFYYCRSVAGSEYAFGVISKANQGFFLINGTVTESASSVTYQNDTCVKTGDVNGVGTTGYIGSTGQWFSWVK